MLTSSEMWRLCQQTQQWPNTRYRVNHKNVKAVIDNQTLEQPRFSHFHSVQLTTWFLTPAVSDQLMVQIAKLNLNRIEMVGTYFGSVKLLCKSLSSARVVDIKRLLWFNHTDALDFELHKHKINKNSQ